MMKHPKSREEVISIFRDLYKEGYRYVVRDRVFPNLIVFSLKPKNTETLNRGDMLIQTHKEYCQHIQLKILILRKSNGPTEQRL